MYGRGGPYQQYQYPGQQPQGFQPMQQARYPPQQQYYVPQQQQQQPQHAQQQQQQFGGGGGGGGRPPIDPSTGHDYRRGDDGSVRVDLGRVHHLLAKRLGFKMSRNYQEADRVRQELRAMGVEVQDKLKIWTARAVAQPQGGVPQGGVPQPQYYQQYAQPQQYPQAPQQSQQRFRANTRGLIDPQTGHDYRRHEADTHVTDVAAVDALVAKRLQCKMSGQYAEADAVRERLRSEFGVEVQDRDKLWRVVFQPQDPLALAAATAKALSAQLQKRPREDLDLPSTDEPQKVPKVLGEGDTDDNRDTAEEGGPFESTDDDDNRDTADENNNNNHHDDGDDSRAGAGVAPPMEPPQETTDQETDQEPLPTTEEAPTTEDDRKEEDDAVVVAAEPPLPDDDDDDAEDGEERGPPATILPPPPQET